jgi:hypothetical protein
MSGFIQQYERLLGNNHREGKVYAFSCPFEGCMGYRGRKFYVDPRTGYWFCLHCNQIVPWRNYRPTDRLGHGGTWKDFFRLMVDQGLEEKVNFRLWPKEDQEDNLAEHPILPMEEAQEIWGKLFEYGTLYSEHRDLMLRKGIDPERAGMVSASREVLKRLLKEYGEAALIKASLVYRSRHHELDTNRCVTEGRTLVPYLKEGKVVYFIGYQKPPEKGDMAPEEYQKLVRNWPNAAGPYAYPTQVYGEFPWKHPYLIVTEGQLKALAAIQRGLACVGITGIGSCHREIVEGCCKASISRVVIVFDTQMEGQENVDHAEQQLAQQLLRKHIEVFRVRLPLELEIDDGLKMDLDSYLLHHSTQDFIRLMGGAQSYILESDLARLEREEKQSV